MKTTWIQINNWRKYNEAKKTVKATSWYRMENDWLEHPDFFGLDNDQRILWAYLLGKAGPKLEARGVIYINIEHAKFVTKAVTEERVCETLKYFHSKNLVRLISHPSEAVFEEDQPKPDENPPKADDNPPLAIVPNTSGTDSEDVRNAFGTDAECIPDTFRPTERNVTRRNETERNDTEGETRAPARDHAHVDPPPPEIVDDSPQRTEAPPPLACPSLCRDTGLVVAEYPGIGERRFTCTCDSGQNAPPDPGIEPWDDNLSLNGWMVLLPERDDDNMRAACWMRDTLQKLNPKLRQVQSASMEEWSAKIGALRKDFGIKNSDLSETIKFALTHAHWKARILSPHKLREKWDEVVADMASDEALRQRDKQRQWKKQGRTAY